MPTMLGTRPRAAIVSAALAGLLVLLLVILPSPSARAQYPPPTPEPTSTTIEGELECEIEAGPDFLIVRCTGSGFAPGAEVLVQIHAAGLVGAPEEQQVDEFTVFAGNQGDVQFERTIASCDLTGLRVVGTGEAASGDILVSEDVIDDPALLACVSGALATTGFDWLRLLAVGLWLLTAGVWVANVRDERSHLAAA